MRKNLLQSMVTFLLPFACFSCEGMTPEIPKNLYQFKVDLIGETIYEIVDTDSGLGFSIAIADITESSPHKHLSTKETYTILDGILEVSIEDKKYILQSGEVISIPLNAVHSAKSLTNQPARVLVSCTPGWTQEDHIQTECSP